MQASPTTMHPDPTVIDRETLRTDVICFATASALSLGVSQMIGIPRLVHALAMNVICAIGAVYYALQCKIAESRECPDAQLSQYYRYQWQQYHNSLTAYSRDFCASAISLVPLIGVIAAGAFLMHTSPTPIEGTTIQKCCRAYAEYTMSPFAFFARIALYPLGYLFKNHETTPSTHIAKERTYRNYEVAPQPLFADVTYKTFPLPVDRGDGLPHAIRCSYLPAKNVQTPLTRMGLQPRDDAPFNPGKTMVLFHGNGMDGEEMMDIAAFYGEAGWNVMMPTMGGYHRSDESIYTTEASTIQDVYAILKYLEAQGIEEIGVHGSSIGGSLAMHATQLSQRVRLAVIDKTFDNAQNVAVNTVNNIDSPLANLIPSELVKALFRQACPIGLNVDAVRGIDGQDYQTDGLDNVKKAAHFRGKLITIVGNGDHLMSFPSATSENPRQRSNLAKAIHDAHLSTSDSSNSIYIITPSGHSINILPQVANHIRTAIA